MNEALMEMIENKNYTAISGLFATMNEVDIAEVFNELSEKDTVKLFRMMKKDDAAEVFSYLDSDVQQSIIESISDKEITGIIDEMFLDDVVDMVEEMPANVVKKILKNVHEEKRKLINQFLQYPEYSVGSIMTIEFIDLKENSTVEQAFERIRTTGMDSETIYTCYVIRQDRVLVGTVSAKALMLSSPGQRIIDIMDPQVIFAHTTDDREEIARDFTKYGLLAMPVVDKEQRLVGIVTVDDVVQIIEEENTEDFERMAALNPSDEPYLKTGVLKLARNRILWLLILMISATITGGIITGFEEELAVLPILMAFIPMLMDTGGNAGSQASTLVIRGMAIEEIRPRDLHLVLWKEIRVAFICGITLGIVNFVRIFLMNGRDVFLSFTVSISVFFTVMMAKTIGCLLPVAAKKIGIDPAIMAAPLITTIVDAASLVIYFAIARAIFAI